jgi:hypothetical protein
MVAAIVVAVLVIAAVGAAITLGGDDEPSGTTRALRELSDRCEDGDLEACDELYFEAPEGSEAEELGSTCGGRTDPQLGACSLGDIEVEPGAGSAVDPNVEPEGSASALADACEEGDDAACDQLYEESPIGSPEEELGSTCGGRQEPQFGSCVDDPDEVAMLEQLVDDCTAGDNAACDELYIESPIGSEEEVLGSTCAGRSDEELFGDCASQLGPNG